MDMKTLNMKIKDKKIQNPCKVHQSRLFHVSKKLDYGLFLLTRLTQTKTPLSVKKIAQENNTSFYFLQKIARDLKKSQIIKANRGKNGGYQLVKKANKISLKEIVESLEGPIRVVPCLKNNPYGVGENCSRESRCTMKNGMRKINGEIENMLFEKKLDYFIS